VEEIGSELLFLISFSNWDKASSISSAPTSLPNEFDVPYEFEEPNDDYEFPDGVEGSLTSGTEGKFNVDYLIPVGTGSFEGSFIVGI